jgi:hypothetical protein
MFGEGDRPALLREFAGPAPTDYLYTRDQGAQPYAAHGEARFHVAEVVNAEVYAAEAD